MDIGAALAPWPAPNSTATRTMSVFQQSLERAAPCFYLIFVGNLLFARKVVACWRSAAF
jgi:hypothetical protein